MSAAGGDPHYPVIHFRYSTFTLLLTFLHHNHSSVLLHCAITSKWNASAMHGNSSWNVLVHLTQIERALDSAVIMKILCLFLVALLCVSFIEAGRKKSRGGGKNGGDNGNKNLGNSMSTSVMRVSISVLGVQLSIASTATFSQQAG